MKNIAVIGSKGFVGSEICKAINQEKNYNIIQITRGDDIYKLLSVSDIIIHSANPAGRFKAESKPENDFLETVEKTLKILEIAENKKIILISSLSCRTQMDTNYGRNRRSCELMTLLKGGKVIRLGPMFGGNRKKDVLHDILNHKNVYVSNKTKYAYVNVSWAASKILELISSPPGLYEIGARNSVTLSELAKYFNSRSLFSGKIDTQILEHYEKGPDARLVFEYAKEELKDIKN